MKIGIVSTRAIGESGRLDADFYIGDKLERAVKRDRERVRRALACYRRSQAAVKKRDEERARMGIVVK